jgi:hypothetical protein
MTIDRCLLGSLRIAAVMTVLLALTPPAEAQWGMGYGYGFGMFGGGPSPSTEFLNQHALGRIGSVAARQPGRSHSAYSGNSNAYFNRIRDNGFTSHYDVRRRRAPSYQPERTASLGNRGRAESRPAQPTAAPAVPLVSFFDESLTLVWPQESPVDGEFKEKRDISDRASLAVLKQTKNYGSAPITRVTEARKKLVDYGRPALQQLRAVATPPIADSFHRFLLSLYDSLEAATRPAEPSTSPRP